MTNQLQLDRRGNLNFECPLIPAGIGSGQHMKHHFRQVLGGCWLKKVASYALLSPTMVPISHQVKFQKAPLVWSGSRNWGRMKKLGVF